MGTEPIAAPDAWQGTYFNYFTEVEDHFRRVRGSGLFLLSPLDWALIESWKNSGVPLQAVLRGIDVAFEKWRSRKQKFRAINSVAYCTQAVIAEAQLMAGVVPAAMSKQVAAPFTLEELRVYLQQNAAKLWEKPEPVYRELAGSLEELAASVEEHYERLEELEQRLTAMEDKMSAATRAMCSADELFAIRQELDRELKPYRGKMTADQLSMLERQYLDRRLLEAAGLPRLSLFYL